MSAVFLSDDQRGHRPSPRRSSSALPAQPPRETSGPTSVSPVASSSSSSSSASAAPTSLPHSTQPLSATPPQPGAGPPSFSPRLLLAISVHAGFATASPSSPLPSAQICLRPPPLPYLCSRPDCALAHRRALHCHVDCGARLCRSRHFRHYLPHRSQSPPLLAQTQPLTRTLSPNPN